MYRILHLITIVHLATGMKTIKEQSKSKILTKLIILDVEDVPAKEDLYRYMSALEKIVIFWENHLDKVDLNAAFSLHVTCVNLKLVIKSDGKDESPAPTPSFMSVGKIIIKKLDSILDYFRKMVKKDSSGANKANKLIYTLMSNQTFWLDRLGQSSKLVKQKTRRRIDPEKIYNDWETYASSIYSEKNAVPNPDQFEKCLATLARNPASEATTIPTCTLDKNCYSVISDGTDFGYALTHRVWLVNLAQYSRGCVVYTLTADRALINYMCSFAYREATYIAEYMYRAIDLMVEQILVCALEGRTEFLHRVWLHNMLRFQLPNGCLGQIDTKDILRTWEMHKTQDGIPTADGTCKSHLTVTAAAVLAITIRNIMNTLRSPPAPTKAAVTSVVTTFNQTIVTKK